MFVCLFVYVCISCALRMVFLFVCFFVLFFLLCNELMELQVIDGLGLVLG